jgi:hypothetical protein
MTSSTGAGTGKESAMTVEDLTKRFAAMKKLLRPLQPLVETVQKLSARVADQDQQQRALNLALLHLEHGDGAPPPPPPPPADGVPPPPRNQGTGSTNASVAGYTGPHRPPRADEDDDGGDFLPTYHKLNFPKFDGSSDPLS